VLSGGLVERSARAQPVPVLQVVDAQIARFSVALSVDPERSSYPLWLMRDELPVSPFLASSHFSSY